MKSEQHLLNLTTLELINLILELKEENKKLKDLITAVKGRVGKYCSLTEGE
jgi:hypothetical protein